MRRTRILVALAAVLGLFALVAPVGAAGASPAPTPGAGANMKLLPAATLPKVTPMAMTLQIPTTTIPVDTNGFSAVTFFGPIDAGMAASQVILTLDRTVAGGFNAHPSTTLVFVTLQVSTDSGALWSGFCGSGVAGDSGQGPTTVVSCSLPKVGTQREVRMSIFVDERPNLLPLSTITPFTVKGTLTTNAPLPPPLTCGSTVTHSMVLHANLDCTTPQGDSPMRVALFVGDGVTIDLNGLTIIGDIEASTPAGTFTLKGGTLIGGIFGDFGGARKLILSYMHIVATTFGLSSFPQTTRISLFGTTADIENSLFDGGNLSLFGSGNVTIRRNRFNGTVIGIANADGVTIQNDTFLGGGVSWDNEPFHFQNVSNVTITGSYFLGSNPGISMKGAAPNITIKNNTFEANHIGILIANGELGFKGFFGFGGLCQQRDPPESCSDTIANNVFSHNDVAGIYLQGGGTGKITGNLFSQNGFHPDPAFKGVNDGLFVDPIEPENDNAFGVIPAHIIPTNGIVVARNTALRNADYGLQVPGVTDGGGNVARYNGNRAQCLGVVCH